MQKDLNLIHILCVHTLKKIKYGCGLFFFNQKTLKLDPNQRYLIEDCLEHEAFRTEHLLNRNQIQLRRINTQSASKKRKNNYTEQLNRLAPPHTCTISPYSFTGALLFWGEQTNTFWGNFFKYMIK